MYTDQTPNARYGRITMRVWTAANAVLLVAASAGLWFFAARANRRGIQPNTSLGFRSQHTMASLHGWYVAQRVGFHFAAVSTTVVSVAVLVFVVVAYARRLNPMWIMIVPAIGGLAVGACLILAGQRADKAAISVETPQARRSVTNDCWADCRGQWVQIRYALESAGALTEDLKGDVPYPRTVLTLSARPASGGH